MREKIKTFIILLILFMAPNRNCLLAQSPVVREVKAISFSSLLAEMANRDELAKYPGGNWTLHHISSYDRHSVAKGKPGWFANRDWDNFIRKETNHGRGEYVLMDVEGPGAITRFWVAGFPERKGYLRFYIDGQDTPFWEGDRTGALIGQNNKIGLPLSQRSVERDSLTIIPGSRPGYNLYAPIPFRHHIKITYQRVPDNDTHGFWYNIDFRIYEKSTDLRSFSALMSKAEAALLQRTNLTFLNFMEGSAETTTTAGERTVKDLSFNLAPGESKSISFTEAGAIRRLVLMPHGGGDSALKNLWISLSFDGKKTAELPTGFFFGCGSQIVESRNWYSKVDSSGIMAVYWVMPYQHIAVINLSNKGKQYISGAFKAIAGNWKWNQSSMYFHSASKKLLNYMTVARQGKDFNYLTLENKAGVYVGDMLQVTKNVGGWWGEGDEKIYTDNTTFPMDFGTGSEDYYGYAWGHPETFNHIFNAQPLGNANRMDTGGRTVNVRVRNLDAIPFHKLFKFDIESWNWFGGPVNFEWSCFWYELPH